MATTKKQRISIWIIAIVLTFGTFGSFLAIALNISNESKSTAAYQTAYSQYEKDINNQATELSNKYYSTFSQYASIPTLFDKSGVTELVSEDLLIGDGDEITADTDYSAYYIGWLPDGTIFDESISDGALKTPLSKSTSLISGWTSGIIGMKMGGVRELTIPSDQAYGSDGYSDTIPADTPLKFIIMIIPRIDDVEIPQAILDYYAS